MFFIHRFFEQWGCTLLQKITPTLELSLENQFMHIRIRIHSKMQKYRGMTWQ